MTAPIAIAILLALSNVSWAAQMITDPDPWAGFGPVSFVIGASIVAVLAIVGLLLGRAPWSLHITAILGATYIVGYLTISAPNGFGYAALGFAALAVVAAYGPWLKTWMRKRPSAIGPGRVPSIMMLVALFAPLGTALVQPARVSIVYLALAVVAVVGTWAYSQAHVWGLWTLRIGIPVASVATAVAATTVWAVAAVIAYGVTLTVLTWRPEPLVMVQPLVDVPLAKRFVPLDPPTPEATS